MATEYKSPIAAPFAVRVNEAEIAWSDAGSMLLADRPGRGLDISIPPLTGAHKIPWFETRQPF